MCAYPKPHPCSARADVSDRAQAGIGGFEKGKLEHDGARKEVAAQICVRRADTVQLRAGEVVREGVMVRIRLPPAESLQTFGSSRAATATLAHTLSNCCLTTVASAVLLWPFGWGARSKPRLAAMCVWAQSAISAIV